MNRSIRLALATLLALSSALMAGPRVPRGIYATVGIHMYEHDYETANGVTSVPADYFKLTVYPDLLANTDLSGITLYVYWSRLNPNPAPVGRVELGYVQYDWTVVQDLFDAVETYNTAHKTQKTVQLVVTPGINSPTWLLGTVGNNDGLVSSCNYLFDGTYRLPPAGECGKVTFTGFGEGGYDKASGKATDQDVPMPWNSTYKNAWHTFLTALAKQYGSRPELVSIAIAGPTASSEEMILPTSTNTYGGKDGPYKGKGGPQLGGYTAEQMWIELLKNHYTSAYKDYKKYLNTDVAFVDEWENAIKFYENTFSEITLTVSTGDGLPNLDSCNAKDPTQTCSFSIPASPIDFRPLCHPGSMDCAAEATILAYFNQVTGLNVNAKATQMDGMKGGAIQGNLAVPAVRLISESTAMYTSPSQRILGGSQFAHRFSEVKQSEIDNEGGCPSTCTPEQALYNVLAGFFDGTNQSLSFPQGTVMNVGGQPGPAPLNYLQIWGKDIQYAWDHRSDPKVPVVGLTKNVSVQDLLDKANLSLTMIAEN